MNKKLTLAVVATAVAGLMALVGAPLLSQSRAASAANHSGRLASHGSNNDGHECFHEQKPPTEPVHLHGKTLQPHPYKRDYGAPGLGPQDHPKATAAQLLAVYGPSALSAQSGTYELAGGKLTTRPLVARSTRPMAPGAFSTSSYKLDGKTLTITQERGFDGKPVANPTTWKLTRIE